MVFTVRIENIKGTIRMLNKLEKGFPLVAREVRKNFATYLRREMRKIIRKEANWKDDLAKSTSLRTLPKKWFLTVFSPYAIPIHNGARAHFVYRNMETGMGYKFGDWMDDKGFPRRWNRVKVTGAKHGRGIRFVPRAMYRLSKNSDQIIKNAWNKHMRGALP